MTTAGIGPTSLLFAGTACLATAGALSGSGLMTGLATAGLAVFVALEFRHIRRAQQIAALLLLAVAAAVALSHGDLVRAAVEGVRRTLPFLLVFAAVGWLRAAAGESPSVAALRAGLGRMGPGRRFAAFGLSAHAMGAGFNLAGIGLLAPMLEDGGNDPHEAMRLRCAIMWGFGAATCWSPFYVGTAAVLSALPSVDWVQVLPYGLLIAAGLLGWGMLFDRLFRRRGGASGPAEPIRGLGRPVARLLVAIALLFALTMALVEGLGLALTTAIALSAPSYALGWLWLVHGRRHPERIGRISAAVVGGYAGMRTETALFVCANIFGAAVSAVLPGAAAGGVALPGLTGLAFVDALLVIWAYLAVCAAGLHPVVLLVIFTSATDPAALGIPLPLLAAVMMALWGMGTAVSPLSGTTLFMSQLSSASSFTIAWRWNGLFTVLSAVWLAAVLALAV